MERNRTHTISGDMRFEEWTISGLESDIIRTCRRFVL
jgi:hypothetical protein